MIIMFIDNDFYNFYIKIKSPKYNYLFLNSNLT